MATAKKTRIDLDGRFVTDDGTPIQFLPDVPANSPPHELIHTAEADPDSPDGFRHYAIGADPDVVQEIADFYEAAGRPVPDGYVQAAADHAAHVEATAAAADK